MTQPSHVGCRCAGAPGHQSQCRTVALTLDEMRSSAPIGAIAAEHPEFIPLFERFGLDYCCHGDRTLAEACEHRGVNPVEVLDAIRNAGDGAADAPDRNWTGATMSELADHIEQTHHAYAKEAFVRLEELSREVAAAHAAQHPELLVLADRIIALADDMRDHMVREERVLFPWLRRLERRSEITSSPPWSVRRPIECMEHDHDGVAASFARISELSGGYSPPADACGKYRFLLTLLRDLERDTHIHIHKENNILFPAGVRAEAVRSGVPLAVGGGSH